MTLVRQASLATESDDDKDGSRPNKRAKKDAKRAKKWHSGRRFVPKPLMAFDDSGVGMQAPYKLPVDAKEVEYFRIFFDGELVSDIKNHTNAYADELIAKGTKTKTLAGWVRTTTNEIYSFLAIIILMGVVVKKSIKDYWSCRPIVKTPFFGEVFSRKRFLELLRVLHFTSASVVHDSADRLRKIRPIMSFLQSRFSEVFLPSRNLCIDESLLLWKGRLLFKQYIPNKRNRFGIKLFVLCDCQTRYILQFVVYAGKNPGDITVDKRFGQSGSVVNTLMSPYLGKGHILYVDNWYSSPTFFLHLLKFDMGACGTVRTKCLRW